VEGHTVRYLNLRHRNHRNSLLYKCCTQRSPPISFSVHYVLLSSTYSPPGTAASKPSTHLAKSKRIKKKAEN
jgi:hypothetical protein